MTTENIIYYVLIAASVIGLVSVIFYYYREQRKRVQHSDRLEKSNKLIDLLGGFDNIMKYEFKGTRFKVELRDLTLANKEEIQALGANGIMEVNNTLQIILGAESKKLKDIIEELDK